MSLGLSVLLLHVANLKGIALKLICYGQRSVYTCTSRLHAVQYLHICLFPLNTCIQHLTDSLFDYSMNAPVYIVCT